MEEQWRHVVAMSLDSAFLQGLAAPLAIARCALHPVRDVHAPSTIPFLQNADAAIIDLHSGLQAESSYLARLLRALRVPYLVVKRPGRGYGADEDIEAGALGSLCRPLNNDELIARLGVLVGEHTLGRQQSGFIAANVVVDTDASIIACQERVIALTKQETVLLRHLMQFPGRIVSQSLLCEYLGVAPDQHGHAVVRQGMARLRRKIGSDATGSLSLITERQLGYRLLLRAPAAR